VTTRCVLWLCVWYRAKGCTVGGWCSQQTPVGSGTRCWTWTHQTQPGCCLRVRITSWTWNNQQYPHPSLHQALGTSIGTPRPTTVWKQLVARYSLVTCYLSKSIYWLVPFLTYFFNLCLCFDGNAWVTLIFLNIRGWPSCSIDDWLDVFESTT